MAKIIIISVICGTAAFFLCAWLHTLQGCSGRASDSAGSGLGELFAVALCLLAGAATFALVLGLQMGGAKTMKVVGLSLIPVVLYSLIVGGKLSEKPEIRKEELFQSRFLFSVLPCGGHG